MDGSAEAFKANFLKTILAKQNTFLKKCLKQSNQDLINETKKTAKRKQAWQTNRLENYKYLKKGVSLVKPVQKKRLFFSQRRAKKDNFKKYLLRNYRPTLL